MQRIPLLSFITIYGTPPPPPPDGREIASYVIPASHILYLSSTW